MEKFVINIHPLNILLLAGSALAFFIYYHWFALPLLEIVKIDGFLLNAIVAPMFLGFLSHSMYRGENIWRAIFVALTPVAPLLFLHEPEPAKPGLSEVAAVAVWFFFNMGGVVSLFIRNLVKKRLVE